MKKCIWMLVLTVLAGCGGAANMKTAASSAAVNVVTIESGSVKTAYESYDTYQNFTVLHDMLVDAAVNRDTANDSGLTEYVEKPVPETDGTINEGEKSITYGRAENGFVLKVDEEPETYLAPAASPAYDLMDSLTNAMYKATGSLIEGTAPLACTIRPAEEVYEGCVLVQQLSAPDAVYEGYMELTGTVVYEQAVSLRRDEPFEQLMRNPVCIADTEDLNPGDIIRVTAAAAEIEDETGTIGESTLILSYEKAADLYTTAHPLSEFIPAEITEVRIENDTITETVSLTIDDPQMIADLQSELNEIVVYEEFARQFGSGGSDLTLTFTSPDQETTEIVIHNNGLYFSISGQDIIFGSGKDDRSIFTCISRFLSIDNQPN
ncbi:MAG: hypothetical protein IKD69_12475 [Solobacterium sp.]|nr:hypothetical protein [Solobacterium sp.]